MTLTRSENYWLNMIPQNVKTILSLFCQPTTSDNYSVISLDLFGVSKFAKTSNGN